jgi:hypothetical protein
VRPVAIGGMSCNPEALRSLLALGLGALVKRLDAAQHLIPRRFLHNFRGLLAVRACPSVALCLPLALGCGHGHDSVRGVQTWPSVTPGCERVLLIADGKTAPFEYRTIEGFHGHWDGPDKNLRNWLANKACAAGADAVVNVVEVVGINEDGGREWNIHGEAVLFDRHRPRSVEPSSSR